MEGLERLEAQVLEMNDCGVSAIFEYLKKRKDLYEKFNNPEKSMQEMYDYICDKARQMSKGGVVMVQDNLVYIWAVTYFCKSNKELGIKKEKAEKVTPPSANKELNNKKENKKQIEQKDDQMTLFKEVQE